MADTQLPKPPSTENSRPALEPPQFRLSTLFWIIAALGALFAAMTAAGPLGGFAILLLVLAVASHVLGNAVGTRLRSFGSVPAEDRTSDRSATEPQHVRLASAPASNLSLRTNVSLSMIVITVASATALGAAGGTLLIWLTWNQLNVPTAIVAVVSPTVLGGLIGFTISSFTQTAGGAWREAQRSYHNEKMKQIAIRQAYAATQRHGLSQAGRDTSELRARSPDRA